jgi:hypothetical protein
MDLENLTQSELNSSKASSAENHSEQVAMAASRASESRRRSSAPNFGGSTKIGNVSPVAKKKAEFLKGFFERRRVLAVPDSILDSNPDKHFCFVSMNKLQKSGMWHQMGYELYRVSQDPDSQNKDKFNNGIDDFVHRNEMVLAWIPKEEFERRQMEFQVARGKVNLEDVVMKDPNLKTFSPHAKHTREVKRFAPEAGAPV